MSETDLTILLGKRRELKARLIQKQDELRVAQSQTGPIILVILGFLTAIFGIGVVFIIIGAVWSYMRTRDAKRLAVEVADLEDQIETLKEGS